MDTVVKLKKFIILFGDILVLYASLFATLLIRFGGLEKKWVELHVLPFTFLFGVWLVVFYVGGLYDFRLLKPGAEFLKRAGVVLLIAGLLSVLFFYFVPFLLITPKVSLFIFLAIFAVVGYFWRYLVNTLLTSGLPPAKLLLIGMNQTTQEIAAYLDRNPQLGYRVAFWMREGLEDKEFSHLYQIILAHKINAVVLPAHLKKSARASHLIYRNLVLGIEVMDLAALYEIVFQKVPLADLEETWFLENITKSHRIYETLKRPAEIALALACGLVMFPIALLVAVTIAATSSGPLIFSQKRVGQKGVAFLIHKFRTMKQDAEKNGPQWASPDDPRNTAIGRILRRTHLDELPQLWNIIRGDLSIIGPRPERPEFVTILEKEIPFYELRHLLRPGISGWAQVNYQYGASVEDAREKLEYDLYYLKNRSVLLDVLIVLRTIKFLFVNL